MNDEFGADGSFDECFFIEWLRDEDNEKPGLCIKDEHKLLLMSFVSLRQLHFYKIDLIILI